MVRELTPELAEIAKKELTENPATLQDDLQHLKDWISKQPHLKARSEDQWLLTLLRGCKFSLERVKKKIDLFYSLRTTAPDVTLRIKPIDQKFIDFLRLGTVVILPPAQKQLTPRFILLRPGLYDSEKNHILDVVCTMYYLAQILVLEDDVAVIIGTQIIIDYKGVTLAHTAQSTPPVLKKMIAVAQDSMPLRMKGNHHINLTPAIEAIFAIVSVFLSEKAIQRRKIHKTHEELLQYVPREVVPSDYGGSAETCAQIIESWVTKVQEYRSWFEQEVQLGTDESKRPGEPKTAANMFDLEGMQADQFLFPFLRGYKFNLEKTKEKIDMLNRIKSLVPEIFSNRNPLDNKIQEILNSGVFLQSGK